MTDGKDREISLGCSAWIALIILVCALGKIADALLQIAAKL